MSIFLVPQSPERSLEQHRTIRTAVAAHDAVAAREAMRAHLVRVESDVHSARSVGSPAARGGSDG
jgi:DNA-binding FadR family transcriptional regulator